MNSTLRFLWLYIFFFLLTSCTHNSPERNSVYNKAAIVKTETEFAKMAKDSGLAVAFEMFAAEDAVIQRRGIILSGKKAIKEFYQNQSFENVSLEWSPDFTDVASSGDLGYTYGKYTLTAIDTTGKEIISEGYFHTVWKKQEDGTWKFVWD